MVWHIIPTKILFIVNVIFTDGIRVFLNTLTKKTEANLLQNNNFFCSGIINLWEVPNLFSPHLIQPWRHQVFGPAQLWSDFSALRIWHVPLHEVAFQSEGPGHLPVMNVRRTLRYDPEPKGYRQHQAAEWSQTTYNTNQVNWQIPFSTLSHWYVVYCELWWE